MSELDRHITNMKRIKEFPPDRTNLTELDIQQVAEAIEFILKQKR